MLIHPFEESIRSRTRADAEVWPDARMLPDFAELKLVKVPISAVGRHPHRDFLETLQVLQQAVEAAQPFDVALMGCGGYGLPLAAYIRGNLSRSAIYVGGGCAAGRVWHLGQPLGIRAARRRGHRERVLGAPSRSRVPSNAKKLEGAAYF